MNSETASPSNPRKKQEKSRSKKVFFFSGKTMNRSTYERFLPIAGYINWHPSKSSKYVAEKYGVTVSYLSRYVREFFPDVWERHLRACLKKRQRMREKV